VREAVFRGDALILDAVHDERITAWMWSPGYVHGKLSVPIRRSRNGPLFAPGTRCRAPGVIAARPHTGGAAVVRAALPAGDRDQLLRGGPRILFAYDLGRHGDDGSLRAPLNDFVSAAIGWGDADARGGSEARDLTVLRVKVTKWVSARA